MQNSVQITITPGTPKRFVRTPTIPLLMRSLRITPLHGGTGVVYVLNGDPNVTLVTNAQTLVTELAPATATAPGEKFVLDRSNDGQPPIAIGEWGLDGSAADICAVSWELP